nr:carbohydrate sulfotransferase 15-like [Biomphalaria glabrata]
MTFGLNNTKWLLKSPVPVWRIGLRPFILFCLLAFTATAVLFALTTQNWWGATVNLITDPSYRSSNLPASMTRGKQHDHGMFHGQGIFVPTQETDVWKDIVLKSSSLYMSEVPAGPHGNASFGKKGHGVVPVTCDPSAQVSETLRMKPLEFLKEFKNPCRREPLKEPIEELYSHNSYALASPSYHNAFNKILDQWKLIKPDPKYRLRCLPYFFLAGQPKSGSTDFYKRLIAHPDIVAPPSKESHWWAKNRYGMFLNFTQPIPFSDYVDLYDGVALKIQQAGTSTNGSITYPKITGDGSVSTLWYNDDWWKNPENCGMTVPKFTNAHHVYAVIPQARIIIILRNPIDRLYSDFLYFQRSDKSPEDFHQAAENGIQLLNECIDRFGMRACIYNSSVAGKSRVRLRVGLYYQYLQEWLTLFPRSQVAVVRLEDYSAKPLSTVRQVHTFLQLRQLSDVEDDRVLAQPKHNTRRTSDRKFGGMLDKTRELLHSFYHPHNLDLAQLLHDDRFLWLESEAQRNNSGD